MSRGIVLELCPRPGFDFASVVEDIANKRPVDLSNCDVTQHISIIDGFRDDFLDHISRHGFSSFMRREQLNEAVVAPGQTRAAILPVLHAHLNALAITEQLVIVDPYFFAKTSNISSGVQLIHDAVKPTLATLKRLTVVTLPDKVDTILVSAVSALLASAAPSVTLSNVTSKSFHDRFWLNPMNESGFISGTSIGGLGKRYALVDRMQPIDAAEILAALKVEGLL